MRGIESKGILCKREFEMSGTADVGDTGREELEPLSDITEHKLGSPVQLDLFQQRT